MSEADEVKAELRESLSELFNVAGRLITAQLKLSDIETNLLTVMAGSNDSRFPAHISLIEAIKQALDLDIANIDVLRGQINDHMERL
jgi:hypothetical protein